MHMNRVIIIAAAILLLFSSCSGGKRQYFSNISSGETFLSVIGFDDGSQKNYTVVTDVLYAGTDPSSRYKMVFYLPDGWDDSYPLFLDRSMPVEGERAAWTAYQGAPAAEAAEGELHRNGLWRAIARLDFDALRLLHGFSRRC